MSCQAGAVSGVGHFALGFRIKSGRAVAVALAGAASSVTPLLRVEILLSDPGVPATRQPYHNGFGTAQDDTDAIAGLITLVERAADRSIQQLVADVRLAGRSCRGARLVVGSLIDPQQVANPHIRAHASEGRLFRSVVQETLERAGIPCRAIVEKTLAAEAARAIGESDSEIRRTIAGLGKALGGPWRADEKTAAAAAWIALV